MTALDFSQLLPAWAHKTAHFSDAQHRVWLRRRLEGKNGPAVFILHNPSTAGETLDDPTSRRGIQFANAWGCSDLVFVNAATGIATDAAGLADMEDPIGPADEVLDVAAKFCVRSGGVLVAAWGAPKGNHFTKGIMRRRFVDIAARGLPLHYLRLTKNGDPEHLLYLPSDLKPKPWHGVFA